MLPDRVSNPGPLTYESGALPKSVVRLTDRPDVALDVHRGRKTTIQQYNKSVIIGYDCIISFTTKKQTKNFSSANLEKNVRFKLYHTDKIKDRRANSVALDEVAHYEPPHQDLCCLQTELLSSLVLKELISSSEMEQQ